MKDKPATLLNQYIIIGILLLNTVLLIMDIAFKAY